VLLNNLALLYSEHGKYAKGEELIDRALARAIKTLGPKHPILVLIYLNLGTMNELQKKHDEADRYYKRALTFGQEVLGPAHPQMVGILEYYVALLRMTGRRDEADREIAKARKLVAEAKAARRQSAAQGATN
jgi:tetratricopeptide (TPR) repeat protein